MRVAFVGPSYPYRGGIAHYTSSLVEAAQKADHEVHLYNFTRQYPGLLFPGVSQVDPSRPTTRVPSTRCIDTLNPLTWLLTGRRIARFRPDLLVMQWWHPYFAPSFGTIARRARRGSEAIVIYLCHNVFPHETSALDKVLLRFAYGSSDAFVVQARQEQEKLVSFLGPNTVVEIAPHPPYDRFIQQGAREDRQSARRALGLTASRVLLFFGLIRPYKGLSVLLQAFPRIRTPDVQLVVAGECYEDPKSYQGQIDALSIGHRVLFHNRYLPDEEVARYFAAADVVVLPYLSATGSGIVQLAFALGVPVIVSAVGGIPEMVRDGETGLLVPPDRPDELARAIDRFFEDDLDQPLRAGIEANRQSAGWERVVDALVRCLDRCRDRRR